MNTTAFVAGGFEVTWAAIVAAVALSQWLVFVCSRKKQRALMSTGVFIAMWLVAFDGRALLGSKTAAATTQASVAARPVRASCSLITDSMTSAEVEAKLGKPDETRMNEEVRGPGAAIWIYRDSRCAIHIFDDKVEFIE